MRAKNEYKLMSEVYQGNEAFRNVEQDLEQDREIIERNLAGTTNRYKQLLQDIEQMPGNQGPLDELHSLRKHLQIQLNTYSQFTEPEPLPPRSQPV